MLTVLKKLGLSDKEVSVYSALLRLGSTSVRNIADEAKVNRGTAYDILKSLMGHGLVSYLNKEGKHYFSPEDPTHLKELVKREQSRLKELDTELAERIPELRSLFKRGGEKPVARYFEGKQGIRTMLSDVLSTMEQQEDKIYYVYSSSSIRQSVAAAYPTFTEDRIKKQIYVRAIAIGPGGSTYGLDERKWITEKEGAATYTLIFAGHMGHIALDAAGDLVGVIMENEAMYAAHRMIFESLWERL